MYAYNNKDYKISGGKLFWRHKKLPKETPKSLQNCIEKKCWFAGYAFRSLNYFKRASESLKNALAKYSYKFKSKFQHYWSIVYQQKKIFLCHMKFPELHKHCCLRLWKSKFLLKKVFEHGHRKFDWKLNFLFFLKSFFISTFASIIVRTPLIP